MGFESVHYENMVMKEEDYHETQKREKRQEEVKEKEQRTGRNGGAEVW